MKKAFVSKILVYPIKSLDPIEVERAQITEKGSLLHDREFALFREDGKVVSAKKEKKLHRVRSFVDFEKEVFEFRYDGKVYSFSFGELDRVGEFFSEVLGYRVFMKRDPSGGFPDDRKAHGPTLVSRETLRLVASWFGISEEEARRRFRTNIEVSGVPPFWEDGLVGKEFRIGEVLLRGEGISKRCPVPTRDPETGEEYGGFVKLFIQKRKESLPPWTDPSLFRDTFYRLCLNTNTLKGGSILLGDPVNLK